LNKNSYSEFSVIFNKGLKPLAASLMIFLDKKEGVFLKTHLLLNLIIN